MTARMEFCQSADRQRKTATTGTQNAAMAALAIDRHRARGSGISRYRQSQRKTRPNPYPMAKQAPASTPCVRYVRGMSVGVSEAAKNNVPTARPIPDKDCVALRIMDSNRPAVGHGCICRCNILKPIRGKNRGELHALFPRAGPISTARVDNVRKARVSSWPSRRGHLPQRGRDTWLLPSALASVLDGSSPNCRLYSPEK